MANLTNRLKDIHGNTFITSDDTGVSSLDELNDTDFHNLLSTQLLQYNGSNWVNQNIDSTPIVNSMNTIKSSGVYAILSEIKRLLDIILVGNN